MTATIRYSFALFALALMLAVQGLAEPARAAERERLEAFLQVTGFDVALESIALSAEDAPGMLGLEASDFGAGWSRMAAEVFDVDEMHGLAMDILAQTLSDDLLTHAADFYATDLGQRLVEVENASHMVEDSEAKREAGNALLGGYGSGPDSRAELLRELNDAVDASGHGARAIQEIQIRFIMAASNAGVLENEIDEAALRAVLSEGEEELREAIREGGLAAAAYTYETFSDEELARYRDALRHPKMQQVYELMNAIQDEVMANRFEALASRMAGMTGGQDL